MSLQRKDEISKVVRVVNQGKCKVVPVLFLTEDQAMKAYWGSGSIATRIL
jgi:hypothetical protein